MNIVVGTDLSEGSKPALQWAFGLADRNEDVAVTVLHSVASRYPQLVDTPARVMESGSVEDLREDIRAWVESTAGADPPAHDIVIEAGRPEETLEKTADDVDADWISVGQTGQGALSKLVVGSTAERLAHGPPTNLAICHSEGFAWDDTPELLLGIDFTDASRRALALAADLAGRADAKLRIVHVVAPPTYEAYPFDAFQSAEVDNMEELVEWMDDELHDFLDEERDTLDGVEWISETSVGYPTEQLTEYAREHDVAGIVLGTAGRSPMGDMLMGSVARGVVKHMPCNVFLAPPERAQE